VERQASDGLQRRVTIGAFKVGWGDPLAIEFSDLRIANASWGSEPEVVRIGHLSALIDVHALLRGVLRYESLRIEDATIVLERDQAGAGNWKFANGGLGGGVAIVPTGTIVETLSWIPVGRPCLRRNLAAACAEVVSKAAQS